jgi:hypothetical protein
LGLTSSSNSIIFFVEFDREVEAWFM